MVKAESKIEKIMRAAMKDFREENDVTAEKLDLPDVNAQLLYTEIVKKQKDDNAKMAGIEAVKDFCLQRPSIYDE